MVQIRYKGLLLRFKFILLVVFCWCIPPQLCHEIEEYEILDEKNLDEKQRVERGIDYPEIILSLDQNENVNTTCIADFCENVEGYPLDGVNKAIRNLTNTVYEGLQGDFIELGNKLGSEEEVLSPVCNSIQRFMYPQKGNNTNNKEVFIINVPHKKQKVVTWTCSEDNKAGQCGTAVFPMGYASECIQKYEQINLLIYTNEGGGDVAEFNSFKVPSCCVCSLKKITR